jgi:NADPH:quinone reductase-like Zn-dependent oxidoreductase
MPDWRNSAPEVQVGVPMRAITVSEFGPPSVLVPAEVPTPTSGPNDVLVEVTGAGVGPWDAKIRAGAFGSQSFPFVPGAEVSGLVTALGEAVTGFAIGDAVFGSPGFVGGYAEYTAVDAGRLAGVPDGVDLETAGGVPVGVTAALEGLDDHLHLAAGETVLVAGAAGGVGSFVVQLAQLRGARVLATASLEQHDYLRGLGADDVYDYHGDWIDQVRGVDAAFDCVGGPTWLGCLQAVRDGGRAVTIVGGGEPEGRDGITTSYFSATVTTARLEVAASLLASQQLRVEISNRLDLDDAARAHELIETHHTRGKIILLPG